MTTKELEIELLIELRKYAEDNLANYNNPYSFQKGLCMMISQCLWKYRLCHYLHIDNLLEEHYPKHRYNGKGEKYRPILGLLGIQKKYNYRWVWKPGDKKPRLEFLDKLIESRILKVGE